MKIKFTYNHDLTKYILSTLFVLIGVILIGLLFSSKINDELSKFLVAAENKSFDIRQRMTTKYRHVNKNIVIVEIDDATYEYALNEYGGWPIPRDIYSDIVEFIEAQKPNIIAFDLLFVGNMKKYENSDKKLADTFKKYDNLYTAYNFDDIPEEVRTSQILPQKLEAHIDNSSNIKFNEKSNYRPIAPAIIDATTNMGHITFFRDDDGTLRSLYPFIQYKNHVYPNLPLLVGQKEISKAKCYTLENGKLKIKDKEFSINQSGEMILNWYGEVDIFDNVSMWELIKESKKFKNGETTSPKYKNYFKDKIVYVGPTTTGLNDIKTVPTGKIFPGVGVHATFVNNMIDNNFIHKILFKYDVIITFILSWLLAMLMIKADTLKINYKNITVINLLILFSLIIIYYLASTIVMVTNNLWIPVFMPTISMVMTFIVIYIVKYFFKSKDYEYTYRLATTDGLTELYNHRYFQEQMIANVETSKRFGTPFSLILTDIDFFKKFNDKYGHQAGDAVLRQVARTLKKNVRNIDLVCRYGGEEMSIILPNTNNSDAIFVAQKLCDAVANTMFKLSNTLESHVTISLGVATYPENGATPGELIEFSDKGLYIAKENGRNQVGVVKNL